MTEKALRVLRLGVDDQPAQTEVRRWGEIVVPKELIDQRNKYITEVLSKFTVWNDEMGKFVARNSAPDIDYYLAPYRSAPIAIAGLDELIKRRSLPFPTIIPINGMGNEIYQQYLNSDTAGHSRMKGVGQDGSLNERLAFWRWLQGQRTQNPKINQCVEVLTALGEDKTVAIIDDAYSEGTVTNGIAPGMFEVAWGKGKYTYGIGHNQIIFPANSEWIKTIMRSTFGPNLEPATTQFLTEIAKGGIDNDLADYPNSTKLLSGSFVPDIDGAKAYAMSRRYTGAHNDGEKAMSQMDQLILHHGQDIPHLHADLVRKMELIMIQEEEIILSIIKSCS